MTVKELIKRLQQFDENLPVVVSGYEAGVDDIDHIELVKIIKDIDLNKRFSSNKLLPASKAESDTLKDYYGRHLVVDENEKDTVNAIFIYGKHRSRR
jgi:hypothetical protein